MKTGLRIYDTKNRAVQEISASNDREVRIYCCGPTVYRDAHVGNLRTFLLSDLVVRILQIRGFKTLLVQNITDVGHMSEDFIDDQVVESDEDKMLAQAKKEKTDPFVIAKVYESRYHRDLAMLNIIPANQYPRASESIELMLSEIQKLISQGRAYLGSDGSIYFAAQSFSTYGAISGNQLDSLKPGHKYEYQGDGAKRFHADWALWKAAGNRTNMVWPSPWGLGFPGWHIECSAMSLHYLEGHVDLHLGGIDLRFPHHENERAQSNSLLEDVEAVDHWIHGEHLLFEGRKMSKSSGNVVLVNDVVARGFDPLALRLCFFENRYRSQMDLTWDAISAADVTLRRWRTKILQWQGEGEVDPEAVSAELEKVFASVDNDLDTPKALQRLRNVERDVALSPSTKAHIFLGVDQLFGFDLHRSDEPEPQISPEASLLLARRATARTEKNFAMSDKLRDQLLELGILVIDSPDGQKWQRS